MTHYLNGRKFMYNLFSSFFSKNIKLMYGFQLTIFTTVLQNIFIMNYDLLYTQNCSTF